LKWKVAILAQNETEGETATAPKPKKEVPAVVGNWPVYQQVFAERHGFVPNLSILDLLLCEGPMAGAYLKKIQLL
jgi:hypothetical protein